MATAMTEKDKKFYEETWKKVHYWEQQLDQYRTLYMRDGTISQKEQADLDARQAKLDKVLKDMRDRTAAAEAADAAAKKKAGTGVPAASPATSASATPDAPNGHAGALAAGVRSGGAKAPPPGKTERSDEAEAARKLYQLSADWKLTDEVNGVYYDLLQSRELRPLIDVVTERTTSKIGHAVQVQSTDDKLEWLAELEVVKKIAETDITRVLKEVRNANTGIETEWELYDKEWDGRLVAEISEFFGGAVEMRASDFKRVFGVIDRATKELAEGKYESAATSTASAANSYAAAAYRWNEFSAKKLKGAGRVVTGLTIVKEASKTIIAGYLTGGAAAGMGTLATAAVGGGITVGVSLAGSGAELLGHVLVGTAEDFHVDKALVDAVKSGAGQFAGGAVAGWVSSKFSQQLATKLAEKLAPTLGPKATEVAKKAVDIVISQAPGSVAQTVVETSIDMAFDKRFKSTDQFLSYLTDEFIKTYVSNVVQEVAQKGGETDVKKLTSALQKFLL